MTVETKVYGRKADGTLDICKASPENRGKGNCTHEDHVEITGMNPSLIANRHNEKVLEDSFSKLPEKVVDNLYPKNVTEDRIQSHDGGPVLTKEELVDSANAIAETISKEDWSIIKDFYGNFNRRLTDEEITERYDSVSSNIETFLKGKSATAKKVRGFLGDKVNLAEFSSILTHQVNSMTASIRWGFKRKRHPSVKRIILTSLDNDMTRERYVASVMFFGGRCCYCNRILRKNPPPQHQASGEHITPIAPEDPKGIHGGTRYGNMVLACVRCNNNRGNKDLVEWVQETGCIKEEDKPFVLGRIQAFRKFALYHEYDEDENKRILDAADELSEFVENSRNSDGSFEESAEDKIMERIKVTLYDLKHGK